MCAFATALFLAPVSFFKIQLYCNLCQNTALGVPNSSSREHFRLLHCLQCHCESERTNIFSRLSLLSFLLDVYPKMESLALGLIFWEVHYTVSIAAASFYILSECVRVPVSSSLCQNLHSLINSSPICACICTHIHTH